jgi:hypothetical protein
MRAIADADVGRAARLSLRALDGVEATLATLITLPTPERELLTKRFTRRLSHVVSAMLLVEDAAFQAEREGSYRCLVQAARYLRRYVFPPAGGPAFELDRTPLEHFDALVDWSPAIPAAASHALLAAMEGGEHA